LLLAPPFLRWRIRRRRIGLEPFGDEVVVSLLEFSDLLCLQVVLGERGSFHFRLDLQQHSDHL